MAANAVGSERQREKTRRAATADSVFLAALSGTADDRERAVVRNDVYLKALEASRKVLRIYHVERKRQL
jgi:hypothetical protein